MFVCLRDLAKLPRNELRWNQLYTNMEKSKLKFGDYLAYFGFSALIYALLFSLGPSIGIFVGNLGSALFVLINLGGLIYFSWYKWKHGLGPIKAKRKIVFVLRLLLAI